LTVGRGKKTKKGGVPFEQYSGVGEKKNRREKTAVVSKKREFRNEKRREGKRRSASKLCYGEDQPGRGTLEWPFQPSGEKVKQRRTSMEKKGGCGGQKSRRT